MNAPITALWVLLLIVGIQQVEAAFISPQIMSHSVGLHPLTVMFSVLLFGNAMGIPGMILGVPITGTLKVIYNYILEFREEIRNKKVLES
jgi:predicted PurR-regulated permease PerM